MRIAYVVSRFPVVSETFIVRELNALARDRGFAIALFTLFPPQRRFVHPDASRWAAEVRRLGGASTLTAIAWWLRRRPSALLACVGAVARGYARRPGLLARSLVTVALAAEFARAVQEEEIEHVHAHFATYPALCAWVCRRLTGVPYSITAHAHDIFIDQSLLATVVGEARFVAAISEFNREFLEPYARATPVHVVRCGVVPADYRFRARELPAAGPVRALCVASFEDYKGHEVLLRALASGDPEIERISVDLVGAGALERELREQVARQGLSARVRFLGALPAEEVSRLLDAADLFVLPSVVAESGKMDGIPVALMEALAGGVPVVSTRLSGIPELVQDGVTGVLAEPGDAGALVAALRRVLEDPAAARARAEAGRALIEREYDVERSARLLAQCFRGQLPATVETAA